jgi:hypothetical protein
VLRAKVQKELQENTDDYNLDCEAYGTKICRYCKGKLRYISAYGFWGCVNYADKSTKHSTFNDEFTLRSPYVNLPSHWLSDIIKDCNLKGDVTAKELLKFYEYHGLEDLREYFGKGGSTYNTIGGYAKAKIRSIRQEQEAYEHLKGIYPKVVSQQCIRYKIKGSDEKFCIPDFICSNEVCVWVVDAKLGYTDDPKMDLYVSLIRYIMNSKNDTRRIAGGFIMDTRDYKPQTKHHIFHLSD